jgi:hypothetical protein
MRSCQASCSEKGMGQSDEGHIGTGSPLAYPPKTNRTGQPPSWLNRAFPHPEQPISLQPTIQGLESASKSVSFAPMDRQESRRRLRSTHFIMRQDYACLETVTVIHLPHRDNMLFVRIKT